MVSRGVMRMGMSLVLVVFSMAWASDRSYCQDKARMGYLQSDLHQLAAFVALDQGLYRSEGVEVSVGGVFKAGPEQMSAFASHDLDFGYVGVAPATVAAANGVADVKIIAQANLEGSAIVVRKGSGLKNLKDLAGKTAAVPGYATVQDLLFKKGLDNHGMAPHSVKIITIKPPEMIPALNTKQIDAFVAWEPYPAKAVTSGVGEVLSSSSKVWPKHPCCVLVVSSRFVKKNPVQVKGILRAHVKATKLILENPEMAVKSGVKFTGMDVQTVQAAMKSIRYAYAPDVQGLLEYALFLKGGGQTKMGHPQEFVKNIVDMQFLDEAMRAK